MEKIDEQWAKDFEDRQKKYYFLVEYMEQTTEMVWVNTYLDFRRLLAEGFTVQEIADAIDICVGLYWPDHERISRRIVQVCYYHRINAEGRQNA